jgi:hypothetical protein
MTDASAHLFRKRDQPEDSSDVHVTCAGMGMPRRVSVQATEGVAATVMVTVVQGKVWMSIMPPFTWQAIMDSGKIDELMRVLRLARDEARRGEARRGEARRGEARRMSLTGGRWVIRADKGPVREITSGKTTPGHKTVGQTDADPTVAKTRRH